MQMVKQSLSCVVVGVRPAEALGGVAGRGGGPGGVYSPPVALVPSLSGILPHIRWRKVIVLDRMLVYSLPISLLRNGT